MRNLGLLRIPKQPRTILVDIQKEKQVQANLMKTIDDMGLQTISSFEELRECIYYAALYENNSVLNIDISLDCDDTMDLGSIYSILESMILNDSFDEEDFKYPLHTFELYSIPVKSIVLKEMSNKNDGITRAIDMSSTRLVISSSIGNHALLTFERFSKELAENPLHTIQSLPCLTNKRISTFTHDELYDIYRKSHLLEGELFINIKLVKNDESNPKTIDLGKFKLPNIRNILRTTNRVDDALLNTITSSSTDFDKPYVKLSFTTNL